MNFEIILLRIVFQQLRFPCDSVADAEIASTHCSNPNRGLEAAVVAAAGWVERLNSEMTSRLRVISHALVVNGIVMRAFSERRYELAADQERETMSEATTVAGRGFPSL